MHFKTVKSILSQNNGINLFRGCEHGCIYCDSRSKCYRIDHNFDDIEVKENALELLDQSLKRKKQKEMIGTGSMTDPYTISEKKARIYKKKPRNNRKTRIWRCNFNQKQPNSS